MREHITVGPSPADEPCVQLGEEGYELRARAECGRFIELIRRRLGREPPGASLTTKGFHHDHGTYFEVVCYFDPRLPLSVDYAFNVENNAPTRWED
jgi:hypothetical protein